MILKPGKYTWVKNSALIEIYQLKISVTDPYGKVLK
jgi:hypothetical protein